MGSANQDLYGVCTDCTESLHRDRIITSRRETNQLRGGVQIGGSGVIIKGKITGTLTGRYTGQFISRGSVDRVYRLMPTEKSIDIESIFPFFSGFAYTTTGTSK